MHRNLDRHPESLSGSGSLPHTLNELIDECKGVQQGWARTLSSAATLILGMFQVVEVSDLACADVDCYKADRSRSEQTPMPGT